MIRRRLFNPFFVSRNPIPNCSHYAQLPQAHLPAAVHCKFFSSQTSRKFAAKDLYAILDVSPFATQSQIKQSYYKLSMKYHPDHNKGNEDTENLFKELTDAYSVLGKPSSRRNYDKGLLRDYPVPHHVKEMKHRRTSSSSPLTASAKKSSKIYDFEAFNKGHYGNVLRRSRDFEKRQKKEIMFIQVKNTSNYLFVVPTALMFAFFFINYQYL